MKDGPARLIPKATLLRGGPDWAHCRSFLAVLQTGSLSAAARQLGLTQPTIARHIETLEADLGTSLFARGTAGLSPLPAAEDMRQAAEAMAAAAAAMARSAGAAREDAAGEVRITASEMVGIEVLPPILARLRQTHPGISVVLRVTNQTEDLLRHEADIAVRMVAPSQAGLRRRHAGDAALGLYAHRDFAARHGLPGSMAELARFPCIGVETIAPWLRNMFPAMGEYAQAPWVFRCDSDVAGLAALRAGLGLGWAQRGIAAREPDFIPVLPQLRASLPVYIVTPAHTRLARRVTLTADALGDGLADFCRA